MKAALVVRVNGVIIRRVKIREFLSEGKRTGEQELVIYDPLVGGFAVDEGFAFEVKDLALPEVVRQALPNDGWQPVTLPELLRMLSAAEADNPSRVRPELPGSRPPEPEPGSPE